MRLALSVSHARWWPHRSGYQYALPSAKPDEYELCRQAYILAGPGLEAAGVDFRTFEKFDHGQDCRGRCVPNTKRCAHYAAATVNTCHDIARWAPDLAVELHINRGAPGNHGAFALTNGGAEADRFAHGYLDAWTDTAPIALFGQGVWSGPVEVERRWGRKWFLAHAGPASVIVELGFISCATDGAYLNTQWAVEAAAQSLIDAVAGCANG